MTTQVAEPLVACPKCDHRFPLSRALRESIEGQVAFRIQSEYVQRDLEQEGEIKKRLEAAEMKAAEKARADQDLEVLSIRAEVNDCRATIASLQAADRASSARPRVPREEHAENYPRTC